MALIKTSDEIRTLRRGGVLLGQVLVYAETLAVPGAVLRDIDALIDAKIRVTMGSQMLPAFLSIRRLYMASLTVAS
jgi:methionine aminopeptidase